MATQALTGLSASLNAARTAGVDGPSSIGAGSSLDTLNPFQQSGQTPQSGFDHFLQGVVVDDHTDGSAPPPPPHIDTDLTDDTVAQVLSSVAEHAFGRPTTAADGHLVRLLLRHGLEISTCVTLLVSHLMTDAAVEEVVRTLLSEPTRFSQTFGPASSSQPSVSADSAVRPTAVSPSAVARHLEALAHSTASRGPAQSSPAQGAVYTPGSVASGYDVSGVCRQGCYEHYSPSRPTAPPQSPTPPSGSRVEDLLQLGDALDGGFSVTDAGTPGFASVDAGSSTLPPVSTPANRQLQTSPQQRALIDASAEFIRQQPVWMASGAGILLQHCSATNENPIDVVATYYESPPYLNHETLAREAVPHSLSLSTRACA